MRITSRPRPNNASDDVIVDGRIITAENFDSATRASNAGGDWVAHGHVLTGNPVFDADASGGRRHAGDEGMDHILGFTGFFQSEPGAVGLGNVLGAYDYGDHTVPATRTADGELTAIATLYAVDHVAVAQIIANGSILGPAPHTNFGGMAGDYQLQ
jgi:hypothetical protein